MVVTGKLSEINNDESDTGNLRCENKTADRRELIARACVAPAGSYL